MACAHRHAQPVCRGDGKILLGAVHAALAGGKVARCVVGIVGDALQRVGDDICHKVLLYVLVHVGVPSRMVRVVPSSWLWVMMSATRTMAV